MMGRGEKRGVRELVEVRGWALWSPWFGEGKKPVKESGRFELVDYVGYPTGDGIG